MGTAGGPYITRDTSLILELDAADRNSYSGSGNLWYDLSNTIYSGSLLNGSVYSNEALGSIVFNGSSSYVTTNNSIALTSASLVCWIKTNGTQSQYDGILFSRTPSLSTGLNFFSGSNQLGYHWNDTLATYSWASGISVPSNTWCMVALTVTPTTGIIYLCQGNEITSATRTTTHTPFSSSNFTIGRDPLSADRSYSGSIAIAQIYNRNLSASEIQQNYNQLKTRFLIGGDPTITPTPTPGATSTPAPATATPTPAPATATPLPATATPVPTGTPTPLPATATPTPSPTSAPTAIPCSTTTIFGGLSATCTPFSTANATTESVYLGTTSGNVSFNFQFSTFSSGSSVSIEAYYNNSLIGTSSTYNYPSAGSYTFTVSYNPTTPGVNSILYKFLNCHNFGAGSNLTTISGSVSCPVPIATATPTPTPLPATATPTPTRTPTPAPATATPAPTATRTPTPLPATATPTATILIASPTPSPLPATATPTPTRTPTPVPATATPTPTTVSSFSYNISTIGEASALDACNNFDAGQVVYASTSVIGSVTQFFTDSGLTTAFNGGSEWWAYERTTNPGVIRRAIISSGGNLSSAGNC